MSWIFIPGFTPLKLMELRICLGWFYNFWQILYLQENTVWVILVILGLLKNLELIYKLVYNQKLWISYMFWIEAQISRTITHKALKKRKKYFIVSFNSVTYSVTALNLKPYNIWFRAGFESKSQEMGLARLLPGIPY